MENSTLSQDFLWIVKCVPDREDESYKHTAESSSIPSSLSGYGVSLAGFVHRSNFFTCISCDLVTKKDGLLRMCTDYREFNNAA